MNHLSNLDESIKDSSGRSLLTRAMGRFYTPKPIAADLAGVLAMSLDVDRMREVSIIDPFCGDGRLLVELLRHAHDLGKGLHLPWRISFWDCDRNALAQARTALTNALQETQIHAELLPCCHDSFFSPIDHYGSYQCVITNPPWEAIKPDRRELAAMDVDQQRQYRSSLKEYDLRLREVLPTSQPARKYAGWGTNLSRCGTELAVRLTAKGGYCGIVTPLSLLMDQVSHPLRHWMFRVSTPLHIAYYPAESRLFDNVDEDSIAFVLRKEPPARRFTATLSRPPTDSRLPPVESLDLSIETLESLDYRVPVTFGQLFLDLREKLEPLPKLAELEHPGPRSLWLGRELDETRRAEFLTDVGRYAFLKGAMLGRYSILEQPSQFVREDKRDIPASADHYRIAWRDVSRRNQSRRVTAAIIPPGIVTGNSLHVGYFKDDNPDRLRALLVLINSIIFEFQVRAQLGTDHISLGIVRRVKIPSLDSAQVVVTLSSALARLHSCPDPEAQVELEVLAAKAYKVTKQEYRRILASFNRLDHDYVASLLSCPLWDTTPFEVTTPMSHSRRDEPTIPNHYSATLSDLDLRMAVEVPPAGNWQDIPESIPSKRLQQIRKSYREGKGSRSTYYGRLHPEEPSYTINTYFSRPGNGCHLHYDYEGGQHRVISQREAARLQSFPDSFAFYGSLTAINKQIGNAVPPLLAYQIARHLPFTGQYVDLFCGAGGLSLGFKWAGWEPILGSDKDGTFLKTYTRNVHDEVVQGDIRNQETFEAIVEKVTSNRVSPTTPLLVLGGPPCQGFSTAGNRRSMHDDRNKLFYDYKAMLVTLQPTIFIFENVTGLLNMQGGKVFELVKRELSAATGSFSTWKLQSERYAVPQRRTRVFLVGCSVEDASLAPPPPISRFSKQRSLFYDLAQAISVLEALSDLPPLQPGQNGSHLDYLSEPLNPYQELMRSYISPAEYVAKVKESATQGPD